MPQVGLLKVESNEPDNTFSGGRRTAMLLYRELFQRYQLRECVYVWCLYVVLEWQVRIVIIFVPFGDANRHTAHNFQSQNAIVSF